MEVYYHIDQSCLFSQQTTACTHNLEAEIFCQGFSQCSIFSEDKTAIVTSGVSTLQFNAQAAAADAK